MHHRYSKLPTNRLIYDGISYRRAHSHDDALQKFSFCETQKWTEKSLSKHVDH